MWRPDHHSSWRDAPRHRQQRTRRGRRNQAVSLRSRLRALCGPHWTHVEPLHRLHAVRVHSPRVVALGVGPLHLRVGHVDGGVAVTAQADDACRVGVQTAWLWMACKVHGGLWVCATVTEAFTGSQSRDRHTHAHTHTQTRAHTDTRPHAITHRHHTHVDAYALMMGSRDR